MQLQPGPIRRKVRRARVLLLLLAGACTHEDSFSYRQPLNEGPHRTAAPIRLTYSTFEDQYPAWLPDGSGLVYSYVDQESRSSDRCLGIIPMGGGQVSETRCFRGDFVGDSTDILVEGAPGAGGAVAWVEQHNVSTRRIPDYGGLMLGSMRDADAPRLLRPLPYSVGPNVHTTALNVRWLSRTELAYIGADILIRAPCDNCKPDSVVIAREVMLVSVSGDATLLPNSAEWTSIWPTADSTGLYYTVAGDTRVFRRQLIGGPADVVYDFGNNGIVRDVSVVGSRLAAVVGGNVRYGSEPLLGLRQIDSGGTMMTVDLGPNGAVAWDSTAWFRRTVLSPDGQSIVAEGIVRNRANPNPDLWLFQVP